MVISLLLMVALHHSIILFLKINLYRFCVREVLYTVYADRPFDLTVNGKREVQRKINIHPEILT